MTGNMLLDWAIQAVSLFNVILLVWLGLTVLLNAEHRTGGILLAGGGLLMGGAFFISHSAILGHNPNAITPGQDFWWYIGWALVVTLPLAWYLVMLWYTGFWESYRAKDQPGKRLYLRQRMWFGLATTSGLLLSLLLIFTPLLPPFSSLAQFRLSPNQQIADIGWLSFIYPAYTLLCMSLSLDALLKPGPSRRWLGEQARLRARPWLLTASLLLLVVSLLVGWTMIWIENQLGMATFSEIFTITIGLLDLVISGLIALSVIALGQAVVSYEIFTARTLPRNGLNLYWHRALVLAGGYSLLVAWTLTINLRPIYSLLLTTMLMTIFFAMLAWRSFTERERFMRSMRPFMARSNVYTQMVNPGIAETAADIPGAFTALCSVLLETRQACLIPVGFLAPLAGRPILFPDENQKISLPLPDLTAAFRSPEDKGLPLDPEQNGGYIWAVPLWSEQGLVGVLAIGEKKSHGLYTQEEIETARAAGERLIDQKVSGELAGRLARLEREHLSYSQVMDQNARRVLHDEILPLVHTALLRLSASPEPGIKEDLDLLVNVHRQLSDLLRSTAATLSPEVGRLGLINALRQVVDRDLKGRFDQVYWQIDTAAEAQFNALPPLQGEVFFFAAREALRNAARYGQPAQGRPLEVTVYAECSEALRLTIQDNGGQTGAFFPDDHLATIRTGQGLALHTTLMAVIGGALLLENDPGQYTRVVLSLPLQTYKTSTQGI